MCGIEDGDLTDSPKAEIGAERNKIKVIYKNTFSWVEDMP